MKEKVDLHSEEVVLRLRIQLALKVHSTSVKAIAEKLGVAEGHLAQVFYYGRGGGAPGAFKALAEVIGADPRYGVSPEVRNYLNKLANPVPPPRKDAADTPAQGSA